MQPQQNIFLYIYTPKMNEVYCECKYAARPGRNQRNPAKSSETATARQTDGPGWTWMGRHALFGVSLIQWYNGTMLQAYYSTLKPYLMDLTSLLCFYFTEVP